MFGSTELSRSTATSGNILTDLQFGGGQDVYFGESKIMLFIPIILITIILLKGIK